MGQKVRAQMGRGKFLLLGPRTEILQQGQKWRKPSSIITLHYRTKTEEDEGLTKERLVRYDPEKKEKNKNTISRVNGKRVSVDN